MVTSEESQRNPERKWFRSGLKFALAVPVAALIYGAVVHHLAGDGRGTFGDMFGALNAVFAGLAFMALVFALLMQQEELSLQRKQLELTRQELQKSAEAQQLVAKLQAISALLMSYEQNWAVRMSAQPGTPFQMKAFSIATSRDECVHWLSKTLREEFGITIPSPPED
jgi:hypothetical protein